MSKTNARTRIDSTTHERYVYLCERAAISLTTGYERAISYTLNEDWDRFIHEYPKSKEAHGTREVKIPLDSEDMDRIEEITSTMISKKDLASAMLRWCVRDDIRGEFNDYVIETTEAPDIEPGSSIISSEKDFGTDKYMEMDKEEIESEIKDDIDSLGAPDN